MPNLNTAKVLPERVIAENIPGELKRAPAWCVHRNKEPYQPRYPDRRASVANPDHFATFDEAYAAYQADDTIDGIGRLLIKDEEYVGIDLDHCVDTELCGPEFPIIEEWAREKVDKLNSWTEVTTSGTGLHIIVRGTVPRDINNRKQHVEIYGGHGARYLTYTGHHLEGTPTEIRESPYLEELFEQYKTGNGLTVGDTDLQPPTDLDEDELAQLIARVRGADPEFIEDLANIDDAEDRSGALAGISRRLREWSFNRDEIYHLLVHFAAHVGEDHWRGSGRRWLWRHQVLPYEHVRPVIDDFKNLTAESTQGDEKPRPTLDIQTVTAGTAVDIPPRPWIVEGLFMSGVITGILAPGSSAKSLLMKALGISVALGRDLLGFEIKRPTNALILNNEDSTDELRRRITAVCQHHGINPRELTNRFYFASGYGNPFMVERRLGDKTYVQDPMVDELIAYCREHGIGHIGIDPFVTTHEREENSNTEINQVVTKFRHIAKETGAAICLAHHTRKAGRNETHVGNVDAGRGAKALTDAARVVVTLGRLNKEEAAALNIPWPTARFLVRMDSAKQNFSVMDDERWFYLARADLPNGDVVGVPEVFDISPYRTGADDTGELSIGEICEFIHELLPGVGEYPASQLRPRYEVLRGCSAATAKRDFSRLPAAVDESARIGVGDDLIEFWTSRTGAHASAPMVVHMTKRSK